MNFLELSVLYSSVFLLQRAVKNTAVVKVTARIRHAISMRNIVPLIWIFLIFQISCSNPRSFYYLTPETFIYCDRDHSFFLSTNSFYQTFYGFRVGLESHSFLLNLRGFSEEFKWVISEITGDPMYHGLLHIRMTRNISKYNKKCSSTFCYHFWSIICEGNTVYVLDEMLFWDLPFCSLRRLRKKIQLCARELLNIPDSMNRSLFSYIFNY